jgi:hypothetical protein
VVGVEPRRVPTRGEWDFAPTVSRNRLAYLNQTSNMDSFRLELIGQEIKVPIGNRAYFRFNGRSRNNGIKALQNARL